MTLFNNFFSYSRIPLLVNKAQLVWFYLYVQLCVSKTDMEEKRLLNKVVIFVFFAHKKYSRSFMVEQLNHWCHMDYFNDALTTFLDLEHDISFAVYAGSESSWISSKMS